MCTYDPAPDKSPALITLTFKRLCRPESCHRFLLFHIKSSKIFLEFQMTRKYQGQGDRQGICRHLLATGWLSMNGGAEPHGLLTTHSAHVLLMDLIFGESIEKQLGGGCALDGTLADKAYDVYSTRGREILLRPYLI